MSLKSISQKGSSKVIQVALKKSTSFNVFAKRERTQKNFKNGKNGEIHKNQHVTVQIIYQRYSRRERKKCKTMDSSTAVQEHYSQSRFHYYARGREVKKLVKCETGLPVARVTG
jgi:adenylate kinase family enzyme